MYVVMGATGHVGSAVVHALLEAGQPVTAVTRDAAHAAPLRARGVEIAEADVNDPDSLRAAFRRGERAFLLNPPADTSGDTDAVELHTGRCILAPLDGAGLEHVVVQSTYGAQPGERCGDLNTLYALEQGLGAGATPHAIVRGAYYFSNWAPLVELARESGVLPTMYPVDLAIPMVAPEDLGRVAAAMLVGGEAGTHHVEGPERYSAGDVAATLTDALGRPVRVEVTPRHGWEESYRALGFSEAAAKSYARMTAVSVDAAYDMPDAPIRGTVTLDAYLRGLIHAD